MAVGDRAEVSIESVGGHGDGIGRIDGFVVFVKGAQKGERCRVKITDVKRTYAIGEKIPGNEKETEMEEEVEGSKGGPSG